LGGPAERKVDFRWVRVGGRATLRGNRGQLTVRLVDSIHNPLRPGITIRFRRGAVERDFRLEEVETYRDRAVIRLEGIADARAAEVLIGSDILLQSKDLVDLPEGTYYIFHLVGLRVLLPGRRVLGTVVEIIPTGGTDLLLVHDEGDREILIPFAQSICRRVDLQEGVIEVEPPEGLLDADGL
jgi:16S rRNA processing protein RimM